MARLHQEGNALYPPRAGRSLGWLLLFVVLSVALLVLDRSRKLQTPENAASRVFTPVQTTLTKRTSGVVDFWQTLGQIGQLRQENARLSARVQQLQLQNEQLQRAESQNATMRVQLGYAQANPRFKLMPATVIAQDLHGLNDYIDINRGLKDGVTRDMTVVSPEGYLVGRIDTITRSRS
ncbi:MAG: rod shape-determining protein MreC, partial [Chloroflexota bacterium]